MKWKAWIAIVFIVCITVFNLTWGWGVLFIAWTIPDMVSGKTYLFEEITRNEHPITFWCIEAMWIAISVLMFLTYFYPELFAA